MSTEAERRRFERLSTAGKPYAVRFHLHGREVLGARLANLSACGCGLEVQMVDAADLEAGVALQALYLEHPDLPFVPLEGTVVRVLGKVSGKTTGYVLVGVDFTDITPMVQELIQGHVQAQQAGIGP
ncbi:MAG TPA: PilZ domain-containing protein [Holophagaceae bacterium]